MQQNATEVQQKCDRNETAVHDALRRGGSPEAPSPPPPDEDRATGLAEVAGGGPLPNEGPETRFDGRIAGRIAGGAPRTRVAR